MLRTLRIIAGAALAATLAAETAATQARPGPHFADLQVYDRTSGTVLPIYQHGGRRYVAGTPGHQYELRIRNLTGSRLLAVTSVDGVNVVDGKTAAHDQGGYVLGPHDTVHIAGWRKSLDDVATFYFTAHRNAYAARTGRPADVGVIGVALFPEKSRCCDRFLRDGDAQRRGGDAAPAPEAAQRQEERLGTGHGQREHAPARYTEFERASSRPGEIVTIEYDSHANLVALGIVPRGPDLAQRRAPRPFPGAFVPDP